MQYNIGVYDFGKRSSDWVWSAQSCFLFFSLFFSSFFSLLIIVVHYCCTLHIFQHVTYLADCIRVGSATASFKDFVTVAPENSTSQITSALVEDQLQLPLDLVIVSQKESSTNQTAELRTGHSFYSMCGLLITNGTRANLITSLMLSLTHVFFFPQSRN